MRLHYEQFILGQIENNTFLLWEDETNQAVVIDPSFEPGAVIEFIREKELSLTGIWLTHAHFDHIAGIKYLLDALGHEIPVWLHPADMELYQNQGMAAMFGLSIPELPKPGGIFSDGMKMPLGSSFVEVRATPGHCQGHVILYSPQAEIAFTGDLIFKQGVGRTDLPGSNQDDLLHSIYSQVLTLPGETVLLPGHREATTVVDEVEFNPYLN